MATEIIMPKAGMAMEEGTIVKWFKKEGDTVEVGEPLLEILTDKVNMEVEAPASGTLLKILAQEGEVLPVITTIGYIGKPGEEVPQGQTSAQKAVTTESPQDLMIDDVQPVEDKEQEDPINTQKVRATPASRKIAKENNIDLKDISGSGPKGRVQRIDVAEYLEGLQREGAKITPLAKKIAQGEGVELSALKGTGVGGKIVKNDVLRSLETQEQKIEKDNIIPLTGMRKVIGERMTQSFFTAPTFTLNIEVDMTETTKLRKQLKETILQQTGKKLTFTDIIILATSKALKQFPIVNATLVEEGILLHRHVHMALAIGLDEGLLVPVIRNTDRMTLSEIVVAAKDVAEKAVSKKLSPDQLQGSTFTISNLGMFGISHFNPIINQPNSAILGVNAIIEKMRVVDGEPKVRPIMNLSLTIDHRVIDGTPGAKFLQYLKQLLENPMMMLI
jgi:pyruvate dehydrogenase E2 component (dihydrolipoamide acetyltransferase)